MSYIGPAGKGIPALLKKGKPLTGLEIGCDIGDTAEYMLKEMTDLTLHVIDPYTDYLDWNGNYLSYRNNMYEHVLQKFAPYGNRFVLRRDTSDNSVHFYKDESFDYVFIDALHTYENVMADCKNYYPKVKPGGVFCGHDFYAIPEVRKAVLEFANSVGEIVLHTETDVWYWIKK